MNQTVFESHYFPFPAIKWNSSSDAKDNDLEFSDSGLVENNGAVLFSDEAFGGDSEDYLRRIQEEAKL